MRFSPEQGLGEAMLAREFERAVREGPNSGEPLVVAIDGRLAFVLRQAEPSGDAPGRASVEDGEIDRLRLVARVAVDTAEQLLGGEAVDVDAVAKCLLQLRDVSHVGG